MQVQTPSPFTVGGITGGERSSVITTTAGGRATIIDCYMVLGAVKHTVVYTRRDYAKQRCAYTITALSSGEWRIYENGQIYCYTYAADCAEGDAEKQLRRILAALLNKQRRYIRRLWRGMVVAH